VKFVGAGKVEESQQAIGIAVDFLAAGQARHNENAIRLKHLTQKPAFGLASGGIVLE